MIKTGTARRGLIIIGSMLVLLLAIVALPAGAMTNPAAGYCTALGYQYMDTKGADGSMTGYCMLAGNRSADAWKFLQGTVSPEMSYCWKQGLEIRTVSDPAVCGMLGSTCAVCVKADGSTQEVTSMMGLDFREKIYNDRICCDPATDRACAIGAETQDLSVIYLLILALIVIIIIAGIAFFLKKKKGSDPEN
jgi:putative hemolysin